MISPLEWKEIVVAFYGSIDGFEDARSIRIMRSFCQNYIEQDEFVIESLRKTDDPEEADRWEEKLKPWRDLRDELEAWLKKRDLEP